MFMYSHLGEDIGADEASRCQKELVALISSISKTKTIDSPLYEFIKNINPPVLPKKEYLAIISELAEQEKHIFAIVEKAKECMSESDFINASKFWERANKLVQNEPYFIQQRALCVYKSKVPSAQTALIDALKIIEELEPDGQTNDPETLGITGAIYKQLWQLNGDVSSLDRAITYYGKCFKIRGDYYTGENFALCLNLKAHSEKDEDEKIYARVAAKKTRLSIVDSLQTITEFEDFENRVDKKWIVATLSHCYFALGEEKLNSKFEKLFFNEKIENWEKETYQNNKELLIQILN